MKIYTTYAALAGAVLVALATTGASAASASPGLMQHGFAPAGLVTKVDHVEHAVADVLGINHHHHHHRRHHHDYDDDDDDHHHHHDHDHDDDHHDHHDHDNHHDHDHDHDHHHH